MSWGERSCKRPCRCKDTCAPHTCNVECDGYVWDGVTEPDSTSQPKVEHVNIDKILGDTYDQNKRPKSLTSKLLYGDENL
jgi:hypothetical protein